MMMDYIRGDKILLISRIFNGYISIYIEQKGDPKINIKDEWIQKIWMSPLLTSSGCLFSPYQSHYISRQLQGGYFRMEKHGVCNQQNTVKQFDILNTAIVQTARAFFYKSKHCDSHVDRQLDAVYSNYSGVWSVMGAACWMWRGSVSEIRQ